MPHTYSPTGSGPMGANGMSSARRPSKSRRVTARILGGGRIGRPEPTARIGLPTAARVSCRPTASEHEHHVGCPALVFGIRDSHPSDRGGPLLDHGPAAADPAVLASHHSSGLTLINSPMTPTVAAIAYAR